MARHWSFEVVKAAGVVYRVASGGGGVWDDGSSSGGDAADASGERFMESLMSLRRSSNSFGLDTAGTDFPAGTLEHVRRHLLPRTRKRTRTRFPSCQPAAHDHMRI